MQDVSVVNRLCGGKVVGPKWAWFTDFLDLLLALLGASLAARAIRRLHAGGADLHSPLTRRQLLLCGLREDRTRAMSALASSLDALAPAAHRTHLARVTGCDWSSVSE